MIKIINELKKCFFFHRWETVGDNGFTKYQKCKDCNSKRILQQEGVYQPIDKGWLTKGVV